ncbi:uncharacterized protein rab11fip5a isoform X1 [Eucyclogobius newberryi]|uniref:uncharacterized protein rab11fip5a isoform X1 n=1 Tax=Eucyclogobius newberryi TaxID=166745 RepID=UPI003B59FBD1
MSSLNPDEDQQWIPTHVQVTVLKGRALRGKGKNGTSDVYTIIQLAKEKYSTCVAEKTTEPEWREECTFELQPGALESGTELVLTVMHRALIGLDVFLGQAVIPLDRAFIGSRGVKNQWYRLNSKTGKKEKERGDIQVTVQFTRNNLTASMYDLVMKDKSVSTFGKLKERIKGKRRSSEEDSSSAILPGGYGSLVRMRQRLPSDGGGEEYYEDDEGGEVRRSKMRTFFLRGKLRKSSDTRSSTSLGSESSESSRGGSLSPTAGISVVVSDLSNSPSNSSNLTADNSPEHTANTSPKLSSPKCEFGDEAGEITITVPQPKVCVNGSHSLSVQPLDSGKAVAPLGLGLLKPLPLSMSLQNLSPRDGDLPPVILADGRRWSFDKPDEEEKAAIAAALEQSGPMQGEPEEDSLGTASSCTVEADSQKQTRKDEFELAPAEDGHRSWFGSKDSHNKPSARPPITTLFPEINAQSITETPSIDVSSKTQNDEDTNKKMSDPFTPKQGLDSELDHSFDEFAACRLQSPDDPTTDSETQHNGLCSDPPAHCIHKKAMSFNTDAEQTTNDSLYFQPMHFFSKLLDTIPENGSEHDNKSVGKTQPTSQVKADVFSDTNVEIAGQKFHSSSPDPSSSGLGSSAEEDGLSCVSSCSLSDKLSSSEETEVQNFEKNRAARRSKASEEETMDKSEDVSLDQQTLIEDYSKETSESCSKLEPSVANIEAEIEKPNCHTTPDPQPDRGASTSPESELFPALPPVFITTSSPGLSDSLSRCPFESTNVAGQDQLSPLPVALFTDFPNTRSINPSPDTSLSHTNASDRTSFTQSMYASADSQEYLSCLTHVTSGHSEKSATPVMEQNGVGMAHHTATDLVNVFETRPNEEKVPAVQDGGVFCDLIVPMFETNFTAMDNFSFQSPKEDRVEKDMFSQDINGIFFVEQIAVQEASNRAKDAEDFFKTKPLNDQMIQLNQGFDLDFNAFETSFTQLEHHFQSSKQEVPLDAIFSNGNNGPFGDVKGNDFESSFTAADDFILQRGPVSTPKQDLIVEDVFSNNPNGGYFDDWVGAKIESDYTAGTFNLPSSKEEVLYDISRDLFDSDVIFESNIAAADDFSVQSRTQEADDAYSTHQAKVFDNRDIFGTGSPAVDTFNLQSHAHPRHESLKGEHASLQRSQSEGVLSPAFGELQASAFGSDPEFTSFKPQPDLLLFSPFPPSLTPQCSSSPLALCPPPPVADAATRGSPTQQQQRAANQLDSPHPVKPLTTATAAEEKKTESRSMLEKLKFTRNTGKNSQSTEDSDKKKSLTEGAGSYYHLTHTELVALLVQREAALQRQKAEFERQKILLAKRETELKKLKPQIKDLEDYIDTLLVRIMEQKPTLLQVRSKLK